MTYLVARPVIAAQTIPIVIPPKATKKNDTDALIKSSVSRCSGPMRAIAPSA